MKRVLVVDDAAFMRFSLQTMLEKNGFEVVGLAENGKIGVAKYLETKPDIVTMDITMPDMTGLEALKTIKEFDPEAKVVMISALGQESFIKDAIICGAKYFLVKPFKEEQLVDTLNKILNC